MSIRPLTTRRLEKNADNTRCFAHKRHTVSVADNKLVSDVSFDQSGYSEFKYTAPKTCHDTLRELVRLGELFHLKSSEIVVTGAPNSAHFLALGVTRLLQNWA